MKGKLPVFVDTSLSLVDIDDCVEGHVRAAARGAPGERYVISGEPKTASEALEIFSRVSGTERNPRFVPGAVAMGAASVVEGVSRVRGRKPPICRAMV